MLDIRKIAAAMAGHSLADLLRRAGAHKLPLTAFTPPSAEPPPSPMNGLADALRHVADRRR